MPATFYGAMGSRGVGGASWERRHGRTVGKVPATTGQSETDLAAGTSAGQ